MMWARRGASGDWNRNLAHGPDCAQPPGSGWGHIDPCVRVIKILVTRPMIKVASYPSIIDHGEWMSHFAPAQHVLYRFDLIRDGSFEWRQSHATRLFDMNFVSEIEMFACYTSRLIKDAGRAILRRHMISLMCHIDHGQAPDCNPCHVASVALVWTAALSEVKPCFLSLPSSEDNPPPQCQLRTLAH